MADGVWPHVADVHHAGGVGPFVDQGYEQVIHVAHGAQAQAEFVGLVAGLGDAQASAQRAGQGVDGGGRQRGHAGTQQAPHRQRHPADLLPRRRPQEIPVVAAKKLVARIAGQGHGDVLAGQFHHQVGGQLRGVGEGLVVHRRQLRDQPQGVVGRQPQFGVLGAQVGGHRARVDGLVVGLFLEADGEGAHRPRAARLHQRGDQGRIDAAGQQRAQRHVGHPLRVHRSAQHLFQRVHGLGVAAGERVGHAGLGDLRQRPVGLRLHLALAGAQLQPGARRQLGDALVDRIRRRDVVVAQQQDQRAAVHRRVERRVRAQGLELGAEQEGVALPAVVQRLLAGAVAGQGQGARAAVPQGQGEHAHAGLQGALDAPGGDAGQQGFGVGVAAPGRRLAGGLQFAPQIQVVVDLAVVGQQPAPVGRGHRLVPGRRQVDDGQAAVPQGDAGGAIHPGPAIVRAAVVQPIGHGRDLRPRRVRLDAIRPPETGQSTHASAFPQGPARVRRVPVRIFSEVAAMR